MGVSDLPVLHGGIWGEFKNRVFAQKINEAILKRLDLSDLSNSQSLRGAFTEAFSTARENCIAPSPGARNDRNQK